MMKTTTWPTSPDRGCAKRHKKINEALDKPHRKSPRVCGEGKRWGRVLCVTAVNSTQLTERLKLLDIVFEARFDIKIRPPTQHLFGFLDNHCLLGRSRLGPRNDLNLELRQEFLRQAD